MTPATALLFLLGLGIGASADYHRHHPQHHHPQPPHHAHPQHHPGFAAGGAPSQPTTPPPGPHQQHTSSFHRLQEQLNQVEQVLASLNADAAKRQFLEKDTTLAIHLAEVHVHLLGVEEALRNLQTTPTDQLPSLAPPQPPAELANAQAFERNVEIDKSDPRNMDVEVLWADNMLEIFQAQQPYLAPVEKIIEVGRALESQLANLNDPRFATELATARVALAGKLTDLMDIQRVGQPSLRDHRTAELIRKMPKEVLSNPEEEEKCPVCMEEYKKGQLVGKPGEHCPHTMHLTCAAELIKSSAGQYAPRPGGGYGGHYLRDGEARCPVCRQMIREQRWPAVEGGSESNGHSHSPHHGHRHW